MSPLIIPYIVSQLSAEEFNARFSQINALYVPQAHCIRKAKLANKVLFGLTVLASVLYFIVSIIISPPFERFILGAIVVCFVLVAIVVITTIVPSCCLRMRTKNMHVGGVNLLVAWHF